MAEEEKNIPGYEIVDVATELSKASESAKIQAIQMDARSTAMKDVVTFLKANNIICVKKAEEHKEEGK